MLSDFRTIPAESNLEFDICIIGGGIAGLTMAHEFCGHLARVAVFEAGGLSVTEQSQDLFRADIVGDR